MLRRLMAFVLAITPLPVAVLTHQAIQRAWLPAIPWWDKLIIGAVLWVAAFAWCTRVETSHWPVAASVAHRLALFGTCIIILDAASVHVRPEIAAAWSATWGRIPWWDKVIAGAAVSGAVVYWGREEGGNFRRTLAGATFIFAFWTKESVVDGGPLQGVDLARLGFAAVIWSAIGWVVWESIRGRTQGSPEGKTVTDQAPEEPQADANG